MSQADITTTCAVTFLDSAMSLAAAPEQYPALRALVTRCETLPEFAATRVSWSAPAA